MSIEQLVTLRDSQYWDSDLIDAINRKIKELETLELQTKLDRMGLAQVADRVKAA